MPNVGGKKFSYGPSGMAAAKAESAMTGSPIKMKKYSVGGLVKKSSKSKKNLPVCKGMGAAKRGGNYKA